MLISKEIHLFNCFHLGFVSLALQLPLFLKVSFVKYININKNVVVCSLVKNFLNLVKK